MDIDDYPGSRSGGGDSSRSRNDPQEVTSVNER
jgi:hypothetical protein